MPFNEVLILLMFASFIGLLMTGFPVAWVLGGVGVLFACAGYYSDLYLDTFTGIDFLTLGLVVNRIFKIMDNWILVALPMFIFMGNMLDKSGAAENLMNSFQDLRNSLTSNGFRSLESALVRTASASQTT